MRSATLPGVRRCVALASLVLLCAGVTRAEEGEAPLLLDGGVVVERWSRPAPSGEVHYAISGWYDLLVASGTRLEVVDRATGETRASFDVGCEVRGLTHELVVCDDGVRFVGDLRDGTLLPLVGLPGGVRDADVCGDKALVRTDDAVALFQLPSKLDLDHATGRVAPFRLAVPFRPARASFDDRVGCRFVIVEGNGGERAFFDRSSGAPLDAPPPLLEHVIGYTLVDARGKRPALREDLPVLVDGVFVSEPRWAHGSVLLRTRHVVDDEDVRSLLVVTHEGSLRGALLYLIDDGRVRAYSASVMSPSGYEPKGSIALGLLDAQALTLFGASLVGLVAAPAALFALQPDLGSAALGVGLLAVLGAVPLSLGLAALGTAVWLLTEATAPRPRPYTGSSLADALSGACIGPAQACASAVATAVAIPLLVVGAGLVVAAPFVLATMTVADPALSSGSLDPLLLTTVTTLSATAGGVTALGLSWLLPPPDEESAAAFVIVGRLTLGATVAGAAGASAYGVTRLLTR